MKKLSILVCSVLSRSETFLPKILSQLNNQITQHEKDVELLLLLDNKDMMLGDKRNELVAMSRGKYIVFIDDDDRIKDDYISTLLNAIDNCNDADVINFKVSIRINGGEPGIVLYSKEFKHDYNKEQFYYRIPNHIMCVKREHALSTPYEPILRGEDSAYSKKLLPKLKTEWNIDKFLYYYDFNTATTETQKQIHRHQTNRERINSRRK